MKKLIVAVAMVCAAAYSQAATANWSVNLDFLDANYETIAGTLTILDVVTGNSYAIDLVDGNASGTATITEGGEVQTKLLITNFDVGGQYENTKSFTFVNPYPGMADLEGSLAAYGNDSVAALTNDGGLDLYVDPTSQGYTAAVPEPTSGLLLLLGMAGLALKRKRA